MILSGVQQMHHEDKLYPMIAQYLCEHSVIYEFFLLWLVMCQMKGHTLYFMNMYVFLILDIYIKHLLKFEKNTTKQNICWNLSTINITIKWL